MAEKKADHDMVVRRKSGRKYRIIDIAGERLTSRSMRKTSVLCLKP